MSNPLVEPPSEHRFLAVAYEGAQVRSVARLTEMIDLRGARLRSVVVLPTDDIAAQAARLAVELSAPLRIPVVITRQLPSYVGALDLLVVVGENAESPEGFRALSVAAQRGVTTIMAAAGEAPSDAVVIPAPAQAPALSPARWVTTITTVLDLLEQEPVLVADRLEQLAAELDEELAADAPDRDELVNPARQLAATAVGSCVAHTGQEAEAAALIAALWTAHGWPSISATSITQPLDGEMIPLKVIVWGQGPESSGAGRLGIALRLVTRGFAATAV